jgi:predicted glycosyltransferase
MLSTRFQNFTKTTIPRRLDEMTKQLRILVDIGHPAHVHFFKNFIWEMEKHGHKVFVTGYDKDNSVALLKLYNIPFTLTVKYGKNMASKMYQNSKLALFFRKFIKKNKIDYAVGIGCYHLAWASLGTRCKCFVFSDTEHARAINNLSRFACTNLITPTCYLRDEGSKQIRYAGYHELAYLHPNWFKPDSSILDEICLGKNDKYVIVRFVSWQASHDIGQKGFSLKDKIALVKEIEKYAVPLITSEGEIPSELQKYQIKIPLNRIHDAMYYAAMYIGEGATMASEAAIMGTPSIFIHEMAGVLGTTIDQEKYGLLINQRKFNINRVIDEMNKCFENKSERAKNLKKMLNNKIDVTRFMIHFIENYPKSGNMLVVGPEKSVE